MEWIRENWLKLHLAISPLGTLVVTWLLALSAGAARWWDNRDHLELTGQAVPLGGILYGSSILVLEVTVRMLWALAQRQKDIIKAKEEGREEGREVGREEGREVGREEGREVGREEGREVGREEGVEATIKKLLERGVELPPEILKDVRGNGQH